MTQPQPQPQPQPRSAAAPPRGLSKSRLTAWLQCPRRLWLEVFRPDLRLDDPAVQRRFAVGHRVGEIARDLEPGGLLIGAVDDLAAALDTTARALDLTPGVPLFEPAFQHDGLLVRVDLLLPEDECGHRHHLVEVKSTASVKDYHLPDAAIQAWVAGQAGLDLSRVSIAHLDTGFVYPGNGDYRGLFHWSDITGRIAPLLERVPDWAAQARAVLAGGQPDIEPGDQCDAPFECPFQHHCCPPAVEYPVTLLPDRRGKALARELVAEGFEDLRDVPAERIVDPLQQRILDATRSGQARLDPEVSALIGAVGWPRYYLDFETIAFAVPVWAGTRPYQALPFQWSCHIESVPGQLRHADFLDTSGEAPMRRFAEQLLATLGKTGAIFVYSPYERRILGELAQAYPDLAQPIHAVADRLFDLLPLTQAHYYHPAMKGSWSLKAVLLTVAPDLDYAALGEVRDGTAAQLAYVEAIDPQTSENRREALVKDLLDYCRLDTLALARLAWFLEEGGRNGAGN
jgi:hypothetical protein